MSLHTVEQLNLRLTEEISWRKKELTMLRKMVETAKLGEQQEVLIRSGITILYAHWEGFVKVAAAAYLEFVANQHLCYHELTTNFIALAMKQKLEPARDSKKATIFNQVADWFLTKLHEKSHIPYKNVIQTQSNLSTAVMIEISSMLNLNTKPYLENKEIIDEKLLNSRNNIAHGKNLLIDVEDYLDLHSRIVELLNIFKNEVENAACVSKYRRSVS
jgi:hypothetical protein